jgi:hypothetical protein
MTTEADIEELLSYGRIGLETGQYEQARKDFEKVLALDASNREAMKGLARVNEMERKAAAEVQVRSPAQQSRSRLREGAETDTYKIGMAIVIGAIVFAGVYFGIDAYLESCIEGGLWRRECWEQIDMLLTLERYKGIISLVAAALVSGASLLLD